MEQLSLGMKQDIDGETREDILNPVLSMCVSSQSREWSISCYALCWYWAYGNQCLDEWTLLWCFVIFNSLTWAFVKWSWYLHTRSRWWQWELIFGSGCVHREGLAYHWSLSTLDWYQVILTFFTSCWMVARLVFLLIIFVRWQIILFTHM